MNVIHILWRVSKMKSVVVLIASFIVFTSVTQAQSNQSGVFPYYTILPIRLGTTIDDVQKSLSSVASIKSIDVERTVDENCYSLYPTTTQPIECYQYTLTLRPMFHSLLYGWFETIVVHTVNGIVDMWIIVKDTIDVYSWLHFAFATREIYPPLSESGDPNPSPNTYFAGLQYKNIDIYFFAQCFDDQPNICYMGITFMSKSITNRQNPNRSTYQWRQK